MAIKQASRAMRSTTLSCTSRPALIDRLPSSELAIYLHIPFCRTRCSYCAFNTYTGLSHLIAPYTQALQREIRAVAPHPPARACSAYFGGGTPSLLPLESLQQLLSTLATAFALEPDAEITLEANPGTVSATYLTHARRAGVNRLSLGMQSAHAHELRLFARSHALQDVRLAVSQARQAGFANLNLDLIYGIPRQTVAQWRATLNAAIALAPDHLSLYSLSVEDATPLQARIARGELTPPDPDLAADLYELACESLAAEGFVHYEISNWARPGYACRHNLHVWRNLPYLGFGAGAHGCAQHIRYANLDHPADYIAALQGSAASPGFPLSAAAHEVIELDQQDAIVETVILGLRLLEEGIDERAFAARFATELASLFGPAIDRLIGLGLLQRTEDQRLLLTVQGRLLANRVFTEFV